MNAFDPAGQEFLRISEHYRQLSDEEILVLMPQSSELTTFAQHALANEVRQRGLKAEVEGPIAPAKVKTSQVKSPPAFFEHKSPKLRNSADNDFPDANSPYDEDRKLVELCTVWSVRDAKGTSPARASWPQTAPLPRPLSRSLPRSRCCSGGRVPRSSARRAAPSR